MPVRSKLSVSTIIAIVSLALAIGGTVAGITASIYCTKEEAAEIKSALKSDVVSIQLDVEKQAGSAKVRDWQLQSLSTQMQNVEQRQIQTNQNLAKLLERFRMRPAAQPAMRPLPSPPSSLLPDKDVP